VTLLSLNLLVYPSLGGVNNPAIGDAPNKIEMFQLLIDVFWRQIRAISWFMHPTIPTNCPQNWKSKLYLELARNEV